MALPVDAVVLIKLVSIVRRREAVQVGLDLFLRRRGALDLGLNDLPLPHFVELLLVHLPGLAATPLILALPAAHLVVRPLDAAPRLLDGVLLLTGLLALLGLWRRDLLLGLLLRH